MIEAEAMPIPSSDLQPDPVIEAYKKDVDRTLIRENLRLTIQQRSENLMKLQEFAEELPIHEREALTDRQLRR
jgi:hypothetical protein